MLHIFQKYREIQVYLMSCRNKRHLIGPGRFFNRVWTICTKESTNIFLKKLLVSFFSLLIFSSQGNLLRSIDNCLGASWSVRLTDLNNSFSSNLSLFRLKTKNRFYKQCRKHLFLKNLQFCIILLYRGSPLSTNSLSTK